MKNEWLKNAFHCACKWKVFIDCCELWIALNTIRCCVLSKFYMGLSGQFRCLPRSQFVFNMNIAAQYSPNWREQLFELWHTHKLGTVWNPTTVIETMAASSIWSASTLRRFASSNIRFRHSTHSISRDIIACELIKLWLWRWIQNFVSAFVARPSTPSAHRQLSSVCSFARAADVIHFDLLGSIDTFFRTVSASFHISV